MTALTTDQSRRPFSMLRSLLDNEASGGLVLMAAAALALVVANSPLAPTYFGVLGAYLGPLRVRPRTS